MIKIFILVVFLSLPSFACESSFDCSWGLICQKVDAMQPGVCIAQEKDPGYDRYIVDQNRGGECERSSDCLVGFTCVLMSGGYGVCLR